MAEHRVTRIYVLRDPRDGAVRYVGKTVGKLSTRLSVHIANAVKLRTRTHCANWIVSLKSLGLRPQIEQIDEAGEDWVEREVGWIAHYRAAGADLTNHSVGGQGVPGVKRSQEWCARNSVMSAARMREFVSTPEARAELAAKFASTIASPEWRAWQSARVTAQNATPEWKAASQAYWNEEARRAQAERTRNQWTPERRIAASEKAKAHHRAKSLMT